MKQDVMNYMELDKLTKENFSEIEILKDTIKEISKTLEEIKNV